MHSHLFIRLPFCLSRLGILGPQPSNHYRELILFPYMSGWKAIPDRVLVRQTNKQTRVTIRNKTTSTQKPPKGIFSVIQQTDAKSLWCARHSANE